MKKTLLVIGAGPGIGLATARRFAREGYDIALSSRSLHNLQDHARRLGEEGARVTLMEVDACKPAQVHDIVTRLAQEGPLTVLYNASVVRYEEHGGPRFMPLVDHSVAELQSDMMVNLTSVLVAVRAAALAMAARGAGSIFITGGGFGIDPHPDFLPLSVGKAGIRAIAKAMFAPLKEQGIHIGTVTIHRRIAPDSQETRDIADRFWALEAAPREAWEWEETYG
jgi:short-subunit dehydrogenase